MFTEASQAKQKKNRIKLEKAYEEQNSKSGSQIFPVQFKYLAEFMAKKVETRNWVNSRQRLISPPFALGLCFKDKNDKVYSWSSKSHTGNAFWGEWEIISFLLLDSLYCLLLRCTNQKLLKKQTWQLIE